MPKKRRELARFARVTDTVTYYTDPKNIERTREAVVSFLTRRGEGAPRLSMSGGLFQINWKVKLFGECLPVENGQAIACRWTHYMVRGRSIETCVIDALAREYKDSRSFLAETETGAASPTSEDLEDDRD